MPNVKVSTKYQVVIPKAVRRSLGIKVGQKLAVHVKDGQTITLKLIDPLSKLNDKYSHLWVEDPTKQVRDQRETWDP